MTNINQERIDHTYSESEFDALYSKCAFKFNLKLSYTPKSIEVYIKSTL